METAPFFAEVASAPDGARPFWLRTADGVRIRIAVWETGTRGTAFIFPGRTEYAEKYGKVAGELAAIGLSTVVVDWRGQGLSDRLGRTHSEGHVGDFREFQHDVTAMLAAANDLGLPGPRYAFAHSMGGCIAQRSLMEHPDFAGAVMSAPMWRLQARTAMREVQSKVIGFGRVFGLSKTVSPVSTTEPDKASDAYTGNPLTSDAELFGWARAQVAAHPELALGPPGPSWTRAAIVEMLRLDYRPLPTIPLLVMVGGGERIVSRSKIRKRASQWKGARLLEFPDGRHELFLERHEIQNRIWRNSEALITDIETAQSA
ncbi:alpha/beta hydrolase [Amaricoccus macauensis]|uniref:alpha/beta hydrolase n=1 Tax=Amaricoccus macauensis TaxID=57001 RepID=UPI003C7BAF43